MDELVVRFKNDKTAGRKGFGMIGDVTVGRPSLGNGVEGRAFSPEFWSSGRTILPPTFGIDHMNEPQGPPRRLMR